MFWLLYRQGGSLPCAAYGLLDGERLRDTLAKLHDVFDLDPDLFHDLIIGFVLLVDFVDCATLAQALLGVHYVVRYLALAARASDRLLV